MILPIAIGLAAVGAYVYRSRTSPHGKIMAVLDAHMPAKLRSAVAQVVTKGDDPARAALLAKQLQTKGYPTAATVVATRVIQQAPPKPAPKPAAVKYAAPTYTPKPSPVANVPIFYEDDSSNPDGSHRSGY